MNAATVIGLFITAFFVSILGAMVYGLVIYIGWNIGIRPFGVQAITYVQACGLGLLATCVKPIVQYESKS